jgi:hypothetical protein
MSVHVRKHAGEVGYIVNAQYWNNGYADPTRDGPSGYAASPSVCVSGGFRFQGSVGPPACGRIGNRNETS